MAPRRDRADPRIRGRVRVGFALRAARVRERRRLARAVLVALPVRRDAVLDLARGFSDATARAAPTGPPDHRRVPRAGRPVRRQLGDVLRLARDRLAAAGRTHRLRLPGAGRGGLAAGRPAAGGTPGVAVAGHRVDRHGADHRWHRPRRRAAGLGADPGVRVDDHLHDLDRARGASLRGAPGRGPVHNRRRAPPRRPRRP